MISRGIRLLLGNPVLTARDEGFELVTEHRKPITEWFEHYCGWPLHFERGYVRLVKIGQRRTGPFDRRRYTLLCLVCAELLAAPATTAGLLSERVAHATKSGEIPPFDPQLEAEAFADVLGYLERLGVIRPVHTMYRVDQTLVRRLIEPSTIDQKVDPRHEVMRRLVDDPVVYREDLTAVQRKYLKEHGRAIRHGVEQAGFILEEREEGLLLVDPEALATDTKFPDDDKIVALTLLDWLVHGPATQDELVATTQELMTRHKIFRSAGTAEELAQDGIDVLTSFGLAARDDTMARALPAAARYRS